MDSWHIILLITTIIGFSAGGVCLHLLRKMDFERIRMEDYLVAIGQVMSNFYSKIDSLFSQSIHYYDETIYQFVQSTKEVKIEIDKTLDEYEDLREFIVPVLSPEEKQQQQQVEVLGVVKPAIYPIRKT